MPDVGVFDKVMGFQDYQRAEEDFQLRKQLAAQKLLATLNGEDLPSSVQEYREFQKLPPEQQQQYLMVKRAAPYLNTGASFVQPSPTTGQPLNSIPITPKPDEMPAFKREQERQKSIGDAIGKAEGTTEKKYIQAPQIEEYLSKAERLLPQATSGGGAVMKRDIAGFFGGTTGGAESDTQLDVIGAALTAGVPRMEGPQSNYDVKLYEKAAGDLANPGKPIKTRLAAVKTLRELNNKYMQGGGTRAAVKRFYSPSTGKTKVVYSDGTEEIIDAK